MSNACIEKQKLVPPYLDDELAEPEAREFEGHISECQECRESLDLAARNHAALRAHLRPPPAPEHLLPRLEAALDGIDRSEREAARGRLLAWSLPAVASAAAALALGFFIYSELRGVLPTPQGKGAPIALAQERHTVPRAPMVVSNDRGQIARSAGEFLQAPVQPPRFPHEPVNLLGWEPGHFNGRTAATFVYELRRPLENRRVHVHAFAAENLDLSTHKRHTIDGRELWTDRSFGMNTVTYKSASDVAYVFASEMEASELLRLVGQSDVLRMLDRR
jgi:anti-sigma factor RsiW